MAIINEFNRIDWSSGWLQARLGSGGELLLTGYAEAVDREGNRKPIQISGVEGISELTVGKARLAVGALIKELTMSKLNAADLNRDGLVFIEKGARPIISNVVVVANHDSATFTFTTNVPCTSTIEYDVDKKKLPRTTELVTSHTINLTELVPETAYGYIVTVYDIDANVEGATGTFTTAAAPKELVL